MPLHAGAGERRDGNACWGELTCAIRGVICEVDAKNLLTLLTVRIEFIVNGVNMSTIALKNTG